MAEKISKKALNDKLRLTYMALVRESLEQLDEDILVVASNEFAIPCVDDAGNDSFITIKFTVPTGSRDGYAYDGYTEADAYKAHLTEKAEKAEKARLEKEKKIARDKANREKLAASKKAHTESVSKQVWWRLTAPFQVRRRSQTQSSNSVRRHL